MTTRTDTFIDYTGKEVKKGEKVIVKGRNGPWYFRAFAEKDGTSWVEVTRASNGGLYCFPWERIHRDVQANQPNLSHPRRTMAATTRSGKRKRPPEGSL